MKGLRVLAIFAGMVVDIGGSFLSGVVISIVMMIFYASQGMHMKDILAQMDEEHLSHSTLVLLASIGLGEFCTCLGGFVTGWLAKSFELKNALVMGLLSTLFGMLFCSLYPLWFNLVCLVFTPIVAVVGGFFAQVIFAGRASGHNRVP